MTLEEGIKSRLSNMGWVGEMILEYITVLETENEELKEKAIRLRTAESIITSLYAILEVKMMKHTTHNSTEWLLLDQAEKFINNEDCICIKEIISTVKGQNNARRENFR